MSYPYLVFFIATIFIGLTCVTLDYVYFKLTEKSIFNISYLGWKGTISEFFFWGIGSGIIGLLATRFGFIALTIQSSITIGLSWPLIFPRLYQQATVKTEEIEPEEEPVEESEEEPEEEIDEETENDSDEES